MDVMEVHQAAKRILDLIRSGSGPYFLEITTYRFRGHSMGDPERYRKQDEVKKWQEEDPIGIFERRLLAEKIASDEELRKIDERVELVLRDAIEFAENSPEPSIDELFKDMYAEA